LLNERLDDADATAGDGEAETFVAEGVATRVRDGEVDKEQASAVTDSDRVRDAASDVLVDG
jgi:hypothetical protein